MVPGMTPDRPPTPVKVSFGLYLGMFVVIVVVCCLPLDAGAGRVCHECAGRVVAVVVAVVVGFVVVTSKPSPPFSTHFPAPLPYWP